MTEGLYVLGAGCEAERDGSAAAELRGGRLTFDLKVSQESLEVDECLPGLPFLGFVCHPLLLLG